jgi:hypothetical protein
MTCIVGLVDNGRVWLGGDRAAVEDSHYLMHVAQPKVFRRDEILMGYTSSFRMGQLLQYRLEIPERGERPLDEWMVTDFAEAVRKCMKDGGYTKIENSREQVGCFLVGTEGRLFLFDDQHNILEPQCGFDATGSGISVARGSLHSTGNLGLGPEQRLTLALEAASRFVTSVEPPFDVISA